MFAPWYMKLTQSSFRVCDRCKCAYGFTLLEMSIVLMIMGLLLGSVMKPLGAGIIDRQRKETHRQLVDIREAIIGYASVHHRLPCPVSAAGSTAQHPLDTCSLAHGYVPAAALGITGRYDSNGLLTDSWGSPIQYHVTLSDADNDGQPDFTTAEEMRDVGMQNLAPEYEVCSSAACNQLRANRVPAVVISVGKFHSGSADETENQNSDNRFVSRDPDSVGADQFDDIVIWLSGNILLTRLLQAHVLP